MGKPGALRNMDSLGQHAAHFLEMVVGFKRRRAIFISDGWMLRTLRFVFALFVLSALCVRGKAQSADTILLHARIYTVDSKHPWAEALAIRDGKILAVGSDREIGRLRGASTEVIDAKGRLVLPGFT